jgi:hypothetical protein
VFQYTCARAATLKNGIEALGVPHTEVGAVTVNGEPATLQRVVRDAGRIEIFPWKESGSDPDFRPGRLARPFTPCRHCNLEFEWLRRHGQARPLSADQPE